MKVPFWMCCSGETGSTTHFGVVHSHVPKSPSLASKNNFKPNTGRKLPWHHSLHKQVQKRRVSKLPPFFGDTGPSLWEATGKPRPKVQNPSPFCTQDPRPRRVGRCGDLWREAGKVNFGVFLGNPLLLGRPQQPQTNSKFQTQSGLRHACLRVCLVTDLRGTALLISASCKCRDPLEDGVTGWPFVSQKQKRATLY